MRVIAGKFKGRQLTSPIGTDIRPTSDRVKESAYSIIQDRVTNANFLDLCAGTGNIGIEALSRGAKQVTFLDSNLTCIQLIEQNLQAFGVDQSKPEVQLIRVDLIHGINKLHKNSAKFELIYFDPPYDSDIYNQCLSHISDTCILETSGIILVEHRKRTDLPILSGNLFCYRKKQYGDTCLSFYRYKYH